MEDRFRDESHDDQIAQFIRKKAKKLSRCSEFRNEEPEDIVQDLHVKWLEIQSRHDADRGDMVTYADVALNNHIRNMITARRAQRRAGRADANVDSGSGAGHIYPKSTDPENICDIDQIGREPDYDALAISIDLGRVLRRLSPGQRDMLEALVQGGISEAARTLRISRPTVYQRIRELRVVLSEVGLDEYIR